MGSLPATPNKAPLGPAMDKISGGKLTAANDVLAKATAGGDPAAIKTAQANVDKLNMVANGTRIGLGAWSLLAIGQKSQEIYYYWASGNDGDKARAFGSMAELGNAARIGLGTVTGYIDFRAARALVDNPALQMTRTQTLSKSATSVLSGTVGDLLGAGFNGALGAAKLVGAGLDYKDEVAQSKTQRDVDTAKAKFGESAVGISLDTGNDIYPFLSQGQPLAWAGWLGGKIADHAASTMLEGSGYKPKSFGEDHARNLAPILSAVGLTPDVPLRDLSTITSLDAQIVAQFDNRIHKSAAYGAAATDVVVTGVEVGGALYFTGSVSVAYGVMQVDHMVRQGMNIWTDKYLQRPQERTDAVKAAGLDPTLDTRKVITEQQDFIHRFYAQASTDMTRGYLDAKEDLGGNTKTDQRWLELDKTYTASGISTKTARNSGSFLSKVTDPANLSRVASFAFPGGPILVETFKPQNVGSAVAYIEHGLTKTAEKASQIGRVYVDKVSEASHSIGKAWDNFWK